jgi:hypothetical protein
MTSKDSQNARNLELMAIQDIMSKKDGRAFMWRVMEHSGVFQDTFHADAAINAYKSGRRSNGLFIESEIKHASPENYIKMIQEHIL